MFDFATIPADLYRSTDLLKMPVFSMRGDERGPRLVVTGDIDMMRGLADRFWQVPSLSHIRGSLVLREDSQDPAFDRPDDVLTLGTDNEREAYFEVLGRMTALGMIAGRGVPLRWVA